MDIKKIPWEIDPHTTVKHEILHRYLQAWMPILSTHGRIVYIDGFAGPGEYLTKEGKLVEGSPIIAIKSFLEHKLKDRIKEVVFIFIEKDIKIHDYLNTKLEPYRKQGLKIILKHAQFEDIANELLSEIEKEGGRLAPTFCFIDPFGIKGLPLHTIKRFMCQKSCEVLINFMYEDLSRFISLKENESNVNSLFGEEVEWRKIMNIKDPREKYLFLTGLYHKQLTSACNISYIRTFDMINQFNKKDYVLFFGTNHILGLQKMKESMWKVDEAGSFTFSDASYNPHQMLLFEKEPKYSILQKIILDEFKGKSVTIKELEEFVIIGTSFLPSHLRKPILIPMEEKGEIVVNRGTARKNTYPDGTLITFKYKQMPL